jgi:hypothetical protein
VIRIRRRNLGSAARRFAGASAIVVSIPKSGRSWLRVFLYSFFASLENRPFSLKPKDFQGKTPKLVFTHDLWAHLTAPRLWDRLRGKYLIPPRAGHGKPILLLARDPRDVMVSLFFELTRRHRRWTYHGELSDMIRHPNFGVERIVEIMNTWMAEWGTRSDFRLVRYEDCRMDPEQAFRGILSFLGFGKIDESVFVSSLEFSSFDKMREMEAGGKFDTRKLTPGDVTDPESFKVRRGKVGGYTDYLDPQDLAYLDNAMHRLDRRFGYGQESLPESVSSRLYRACPEAENLTRDDPTD